MVTGVDGGSSEKKIIKIQIESLDCVNLIIAPGCSGVAFARHRDSDRAGIDEQSSSGRENI